MQVLEKEPYPMEGRFCHWKVLLALWLTLRFKSMCDLNSQGQERDKIHRPDVQRACRLT